MRAVFMIFLFLMPAQVAFSLIVPEELGEVRRYDYTVIFLKSDIINIQYPQFRGFEGVKELNLYIEKLVEDMWNRWKDDLVRNVEEGFKDRTSYALAFEIRRFDDRVISITFEDYAYTGGAHGMPTLRALNFDVKRKKVLELRDLFEEGVDYISQINERVREYFKGVRTLRPFKGIREDQEFFMTPYAIVIFFQRYEYTPYAFGYPMILIPYSSLKGFRRDLQ